MSPQAALASDIFRIYTSLLLGLLILAGALLAWLRWGLHKDVEHAWKAYRGWLVIVPTTLGWSCPQSRSTRCRVAVGR